MIKSFKSIPHSLDNWIPAKKKEGFPSYTFLELVKVQGYKVSVTTVHGYDISDQYAYCPLVLDFRKLHDNKKGFRFKVELKSDSLFHSFEITTDTNGVMEERNGYTDFKAFIAAKKKDFKVKTVFKHLCDEL